MRVYSAEIEQCKLNARLLLRQCDAMLDADACTWPWYARLLLVRFIIHAWTMGGCWLVVRFRSAISVAGRRCITRQHGGRAGDLRQGEGRGRRGILWRLETGRRLHMPSAPLSSWRRFNDCHTDHQNKSKQTQRRETARGAGDACTVWHVRARTVVGLLLSVADELK